MISLTHFFDAKDFYGYWNEEKFFTSTNEQFYTEARWQALADSAESLTVVESVASNLFSGTLFIYSLITNFTYVFCLAIGFAVYLCNQGIRSLMHVSSNGEAHMVGFNYLADLEEESGSVDDAMMYFLCFGVICVWFFFCNIFATFFVQNLSWLIMIVSFLAITAVLTPLMVFKSYGPLFMIYLRGLSRTSNIVVEFVFDAMTIGIVFIRYLIQNIRLVMVFGAFFDLSEVVYFNCALVGDSCIDKFFSLPTLWNSYNFYWFDLVGDFITQQLMMFYYLAHLISVYTAQLVNYFTLTFCLFYFLYTTALVDNHERYFAHVRAGL